MAPLNKVRLNISKVSPGMLLAEPITNPAGVTLMPAGIRLTPMFIARIKKWNVQEVDVHVEKTRDTAVKAAAIAAAKTAARARPQPSAPERPTKIHARGRDDNATVSAADEEFARATAVEVARPFVNVRNNPVMMLLLAVVVKRLVVHGPDNPVNILRRAQSGLSDGRENG